MNIKIDWEKVMDVEPNIEADGIYTVSFVFADGTVCSYAYNDSKAFIKDYTKLMEESNKC